MRGHRFEVWECGTVVDLLMQPQLTARSEQLISMLRDAGFKRGDGVSGKGIALVNRLAKENRLTAWTNACLPEHYDALITATHDFLEANVA